MKLLYSTLKLIAFWQKGAIIQVNTFVQLSAGYKTPLNVEMSCAITVQRRVNYGNLMKTFVYRNHVDYYSLSCTFPSKSRPSTQVYRFGVMK